MKTRERAGSDQPRPHQGNAGSALPRAGVGTAVGGPRECQIGFYLWFASLLTYYCVLRKPSGKGTLRNQITDMQSCVFFCWGEMHWFWSWLVIVMFRPRLLEPWPLCCGWPGGLDGPRATDSRTPGCPWATTLAFLWVFAGVLSGCSLLRHKAPVLGTAQPAWEVSDRRTDVLPAVACRCSSFTLVSVLYPNVGTRSSLSVLRLIGCLGQFRDCSEQCL